MKIELLWARESRLGLSPRSEPRNPIRSERVVSRVISMISGAAVVVPAEESRATIVNRQVTSKFAVRPGKCFLAAIVVQT